MKTRVVVAMSGGVDSAVAAALLKQQGFEVIGMTMCFSLPDASRKKPACCGTKGIDDAQRVAHLLGIKHYVVNMQRALKDYVIKDFCDEYMAGRTPNPCVRCNQYLKFGILLKKALALDAQYLATGHYARIKQVTGHKSQVTSFSLMKAKDKKKDQSYFLYRLGQEQLKHVIFPLGDYTKEEVRKLAKKFKLPVADKIASQEICFLPQDDYRGFLKERLPKSNKPGQVIDCEGNILGYHQGIAFYTVGQREGLRISAGYPLYIAEIDARNNRIIVGGKEDVLKREFIVGDVHYAGSPLKKKIVLKVRIRYNHKETQAAIEPIGGKLKVRFTLPQFAITPGQAAVFYQKNTLLGGGTIERVLK